MKPPTVYLVRETWAVRSGIGEVRFGSRDEAEALADTVHWQNVYTPFEMFGGGMDAR